MSAQEVVIVVVVIAAADVVVADDVVVEQLKGCTLICLQFNLKPFELITWIQISANHGSGFYQFCTSSTAKLRYNFLY